MVVPHHICVAAAHGNVEQLRAYFSAGDRDPNDIDEHHGQTLLDYACRGGRSEEQISSSINDIWLNMENVNRLENNVHAIESI